MRPQKIDDEDLLDRLTGVIRSNGYDGASLSAFADTSGLKKASLYHRFPGGKKEITSSVLKYVNQWLRKNIFELLSDEKIVPEVRLVKVLENISVLYDKGKETCILRALSMGTGMIHFEKQLNESFNYWIDGFTRIGLDLNMDEAEAAEKAMSVIISVQGSLVLAKGKADHKIFLSTLEKIKKDYLS